MAGSVVRMPPVGGLLEEGEAHHVVSRMQASEMRRAPMRGVPQGKGARLMTVAMPTGKMRRYPAHIAVEKDTLALLDDTRKRLRLGSRREALRALLEIYRDV